jgi:hypothetical protein
VWHELSRDRVAGMLKPVNIGYFALPETVVLVQYIEETEETAMTALSQNRHILERLADELYTKTKMSGFVSNEGFEQFQ